MFTNIDDDSSKDDVEAEFPRCSVCPSNAITRTGNCAFKNSKKNY